MTSVLITETHHTIVIDGESSIVLPQPSMQVVTVGIQGPSGTGAGITDGDKGDIIVSGSGTVWTIDNSITSATKTKLTYNAKGLVTAGADASTADISDSANKRYVSDAQLVVLGNTSGTNSGDQNLFSTIAVAGQSDVIADTASDTLTLVAGSNITITTNAATDTITIASTGGGGGAFDYGMSYAMAAQTTLYGY